jgi:DNA-3-methyladenine glycosylase II
MRKATSHLKKCDPVMADIIARVGPCRFDQRPATFEAMIRSMVSQQLAVAAARAIYQRLQNACEQAVNGQDSERSFLGGFAITPESVLALTEDQMRACGLSRQKLSYIRDLAEKTISREVDFAILPAMSDDDVIAHLTRVRGVGVWSAQMFLIFALHRLDVMPTADLAINKAIRHAYRKRKIPKPKQILKLADKWKPYRSLACWYLWRSVEKPAGMVTKPSKRPLRKRHSRLKRKAS